MPWVLAAALVLLCALIVFLLTRGKPPAKSYRDAPLMGDLLPHLKSVAGESPGAGRAGLSLHRGLLHRFEKQADFLSTLPDDELLPGAMWLCENGRYLQEKMVSAMADSRGVRGLPASKDGGSRILCFAREYVGHRMAEIHLEPLGKALAAWQEVSTFSQREIGLLPLALRIALLDVISEMTALLAAEQHSRLKAQQLVRFLRHQKEKQSLRIFAAHRHEPAFLERLLSEMHRQEEGQQILWLERYFNQNDLSADKLTRSEHQHQTDNSLWIGNAITSLRAIDHAPWEQLLEEWSPLHAQLSQDAVYPAMDMESRAYYRECIHRLSRLTHKPELTVCGAAMTLSRADHPESLMHHVGYYLLDEGRDSLLSYLHTDRPFPLPMNRAKRTLFLRILCWESFALLLFVGFLLGVPWPMLPLFALPLFFTLAELALSAYRRFAPPKMTPRIQLDALAPEQRTLVVCPTMLLSREQALSMAGHLSMLHSANPDPNLHFMLLGDYRDSLTATMNDDDEIVAAASAAIRALREDTGHEFLYFQRERVFHAPDHLHMSRERKRGSLETLLKLICGQETEDSFAYASIAPEKLQGRYRYVITLDSDTFLPPGAALRLVGAMCHPLQQRRRVDGRMRGVSVLQPRMEVSPGSVGSWLSLLLGGPTSCGPYNSLVSDFYADALRSGSFQGKGIIDPAAFLEATEGKILPGLVLSHDLLEGQLAGCAFASDILLYETHPSALKGFLGRLHRWTRGDWQLLAYLAPFIPHVDSGPRRALNTLDRHKLWGNLFRSLASPARVIGLFVLAALGKHWLFLLLLLAPELPALIPLTRTALVSALLRLAALPVFAAVQLDAIGRALYRLLVSRQNLLKWTTAAQLSNPTDKPSMQPYYMSIGGALLMGFFSLVGGFDLTPGLVTAAVFALFPFTLPLLEQSTERSLYPTGYMREVLSSIARETLLYYETSITPEDNGLPPDNVQIDPNKGITHRTSPTNIGLYLVALISAEKLRLLPLEQLALRVEAAADALEAMEKWQGHLYNWYSTQSLAPLPPAYVSSVDSGNLAVCMLTAAQGLRVLLPDLPPRFHGLPERLDHLVRQMNFTVLFDPSAELFRVGVYPDRPENVQPHYDLLASESRLLSYVAIMQGQVPVRHWYRLSRSRAHTRQGQTLLSYSGTMFEYMMPLLFHRPVRGTLLDHALRTTMKVQSRHRLGGAWGVSESAYLAYDPQLFYQYQSFGIPSLALQSQVDSQVLAPYASVLTLPLNLKPAFMNLLRLRSMGLEGPLGLFEAADFHPRRVGDKKPFQIIRSHMAHHQGMILITICNVLCRWYIADLFGHLPRAQAYRLLLEEKYVDVQTVIRHPLKRRFEKPVTAGYQAWRVAQPLSLPVDAHLLHGAGTTLLIDAQGGGYMSRNGIMLTRFHESCHLPSGMRLYLKDSQSGSVWQATDPKLSKSVEFETAQAVFTHERFHVQTQLRLFVNPLDGAIIHCLTLENQSPADRMLEVSSYLEPALTSQQEDRAHPAFQNLLLQSKKLGKSGAAIRCRPRLERTPPLHLWQNLTADVPFHLFRIQTDRTAFIGRGRTVHAPRGMELPISGLADSVGDMIEPCLSLRAQFVLPASGKVQLAFVTLCPSQRDTENGFLERYDRPENALRTFEAAATQGVVTARYLDLEPEEYCQVSRLTGCLSYTGQPMQFLDSAANSLPMKDLSALRLQGSLPILLVECTSADGLPLVKTLLKAHALLRMGGLWFDLVLLADAPQSDDLQARLTEAVKNSPSSETLRQDGGVHIFSADHLSPGQPELLRAAARLRLSTASGSLKQQLDQLHSLVASPAQYQHRPSTPWKAALPPMDDLTLDNEFGGFAMPEGNYVILLPPGRQTPAPWCNPLCNQDFGTLAGESGLLFTYAHSSRQGRLNHWPNDSVTPRGDELFFLQDSQHKLLWSLTRFPLAADLPCRVTYAPGEAIYECSGYGIYSRMTCFTDAESTLGLRIIQLKNEDKTDRVLTLWHSCAFHPGDNPGSEQLCAAERTERGVTLLCPDLDGACCLAGLDPAPTLCASMSSGAFYGLSPCACHLGSPLRRQRQRGGHRLHGAAQARRNQADHHLTGLRRQPGQAGAGRPQCGGRWRGPPAASNAFVLGQSAQRPSVRPARPHPQPDDEPLAALPDHRLPADAAWRLLPMRWGHGLPGSAAGHAGHAPHPAPAGAGNPAAVCLPPVRRGRRAALVDGGFHRLPYPHQRRPALSAVPDRHLRPGHRGCFHPQRGRALPSLQAPRPGGKRPSGNRQSIPHYRKPFAALSPGHRPGAFRLSRPAPHAGRRLERRHEPRRRRQRRKRMAGHVPVRGSSPFLPPVRPRHHQPLCHAAHPPFAGPGSNRLGRQLVPAGLVLHRRSPGRHVLHGMPDGSAAPVLGGVLRPVP